MKYVLALLLFFELVFAALLFAPIFSDENIDPDALSRENLDMVQRSPAQVEAAERSNRRKSFAVKSAAAFLLLANTAGIVGAIRKLKHQ